MGHFERIGALFKAASALPEAERRAYLERECGDDSELLNEVVSLLSAHELPTGVIDKPALGEGIDLDEVIDDDPHQDVPQTIGRYSIESRLGAGGMGVVYRAVQDHPKRTVALKVLTSTFASRAMRRRFDYEVEVLGRLQHPGIAQVYEAGTFADGRGEHPFFAMELVEGRTLAAHAEAADLDTRTKLELIASICDSVQHAHQRGVIHRDLKPANILVNEQGEPKVLDFGIARATDSDVEMTKSQTQSGAIIGTLPYMSPEQAGGAQHEIDTRADVYALGVIAYELLTGQHPIDVSDTSVYDAVQRIRDVEPPPLSAIVPMLRGDVDTIVRKALEKDKTRRYDSPAALGDDIRRYLDHEPIAARAPSAVYQFRKFARRNRIALGSASVVTLALIASSVVSIVFAVRANDRRIEAEIAKEEAIDAKEEVQQVADFQSSQLAGVEPWAMGRWILADVLDELRGALARQGMAGDEVDERVAGIAESLVAVNFTNVAMSALERNIFDRSRDAIDREFESQPLVHAQLLHTLGSTLHDLGLYGSALDPMESYLAIYRRELGEDDALTFAATHNVGQVYHDLGVFEDAERLYTQALEGLRRTAGEEDPRTLTCMGSLGGLHRDLGHPEQGIAYMEMAYEIERRVFGDDSYEATVSRANLAIMYEEVGRYAEAEQFLRRALDRYRELLGRADPITLNCSNSLAYLLNGQGRFDEAMPLYLEALEERRRVLGDDHPDTLQSINNVGMALRDMGRLDEAHEYLSESLAGRRRALGATHPSTLSALNNMGGLLRDMDRDAEAEPYYVEALAGRRLVLGSDHPSTLSMLNIIGRLMRGLGRYDEADAYYAEALERKRRVLGSDHPSTLRQLHNYAGLRERQERYDDAEALYAEAIERKRRVLGVEDASTLLSIHNMGYLMEQRGEPERAEPYYREVLETSRRVYGDDAEDTLETMGAMAYLLHALGRLHEAETLALEWEERSGWVPAVRLLVLIYDDLHERDPAAGHGAAADEWRARLPDGS